MTGLGLDESVPCLRATRGVSLGCPGPTTRFHSLTTSGHNPWTEGVHCVERFGFRVTSGFAAPSLLRFALPRWTAAAMHSDGCGAGP